MWFHMSEKPFAWERVQQIVHCYVGISPGDITSWVGTTLGHPPEAGCRWSRPIRETEPRWLWGRHCLSLSMVSLTWTGCNQSSGSCYTIKVPRWCHTVSSRQNWLIVFNYIIRTWLNTVWTYLVTDLWLLLIWGYFINQTKTIAAFEV